MSGCLQNREMKNKATSFAGAAQLHPLFLCFLVQELTDTPNDIISLVGHLGVEVDVRNARFLGVHPGDKVLHVAVVAMTVT